MWQYLLDNLKMKYRQVPLMARNKALDKNYSKEDFMILHDMAKRNKSGHTFRAPQHERAVGQISRR